MIKQEQFFQILQHFCYEGTPTSVVPIGNGLINDTYKVTTSGNDTPDYVLQRINHAIFTDVDLLQRNIEAVTGHIRKKLEARGMNDLDRRVLRFIPTAEGKTYYRSPEGSYWRLSVFIPRAMSYETVTPEHALEAGLAFGDFECMLTDLDAPVGESIPDFHNMELRARQLREAVAADAKGRLAEVRGIVDKLEARADRMCLAEQLYREGKLPKRICHCDTKVNNMLFDESGELLCVIDLDTIMPSFVFSDYGDFLRTAANATAEDDPELSHVRLKWDIIEQFTRGYITSTKPFLTPIERDNLPYAAALFPFMQCARFLTDYLNGDVYYKIKYPAQNLDRTRNQLRLYELMTEAAPQLQQLIADLAAE